MTGSDFFEFPFVLQVVHQPVDLGFRRADEMKTAAKKMHVRVDGSGGLQDFLDSRMRTTDDDGQAVGPSKNERQLTQFERAWSLRDGEDQEDAGWNLGQFVNQHEIPTIPRIPSGNLV